MWNKRGRSVIPMLYARLVDHAGYVALEGIIVEDAQVVPLYPLSIEQCLQKGRVFFIGGTTEGA